MGFVLLGTVVYLFSTINADYFIPTLALVIGVWLACWIIGRVPIYEDSNKQFRAMGRRRSPPPRHRLVVVHVSGPGEASLSSGSRTRPRRSRSCKPKARP